MPRSVASGAQAWMTGTGEELFDGLEAQRLEVSEAERRQPRAPAARPENQRRRTE